MTATRRRPNSQHGAQTNARSATTQHFPTRKVFNCIVDDSALVAGVKRSTRTGIRQWVKNGQIRLFVPLHALDQLSRQKSANNRHGEDVRETLQWLDEVTSNSPDSVTLQGGEETFGDWQEVERFAVPRTLFSETDAVDDVDPEPELDTHDGPGEGISKPSLVDNTDRRTPISSAASNPSGSLSPSSMRSHRSSVSALSPPTSPVKAASTPVTSSQHTRPTSSSSSTVPLRLQPLFNYILWRIHQEVDPVAALESFIFLCNDGNKVNFAKGFEIRTKRLEQLRDAIVREDRDFKNRMMLHNKENQNVAAQKLDETEAKDTVEDDDEVVYKPPPKAPAAMTQKEAQVQPQPQLQTNVMDPDAFRRTPPPGTVQVQPKLQPTSPRGHPASPRGGRGGQSSPFAPRGNQRGNFRGSQRGRGNLNNNPGRGGFTVSPRGDSNVAFGRGGPIASTRGDSPRRGGFIPVGRGDSTLPNGQIDPNSFTRPRGNGHTSRGGRKLWVPT